MFNEFLELGGTWRHDAADFDFRLWIFLTDDWNSSPDKFQIRLDIHVYFRLVPDLVVLNAVFEVMDDEPHEVLVTFKLLLRLEPMVTLFLLSTVGYVPEGEHVFDRDVIVGKSSYQFIVIWIDREFRLIPRYRSSIDAIDSQANPLQADREDPDVDDLLEVTGRPKVIK